MRKKINKQMNETQELNSEARFKGRGRRQRPPERGPIDWRSVMLGGRRFPWNEIQTSLDERARARGVE